MSYAGQIRYSKGRVNVRHHFFGAVDVAIEEGRNRMKKRRLMLLPLSICVILVSLGIIWSRYVRSDAAVFFRGYVLDPIPPSVAKIRVDRPKTIGGYGYVFRFAISKSDLSLLRDSRPLKPVTNVSYHHGLLNWEWDGTASEGNPSYHISEGGLSVYGEWSRIPPWATGLDEWTKVESYALNSVKQRPGKRAIDIMEVLIYNEELGEAYFFAWRSPRWP